MLKRTIFAAFIVLTTATYAQQTPSNFVADGKLWSSLYQQKAAEYKALCFQAYNFAHLSLKMELMKRSAKPRVIVTDIDETLLDNSPNSVHQALLGKDYEPGPWAEWTAMAKADTVPGAASFLKYAAKKGVKVYYISNRSEAERAATLKNLQMFGFPNADTEHLILRQPGASSSKETRRLEIAKTHNIIMLLGDNLADFSSLFDKKTTDERNQVTREQSAMFGKRFIVIPNDNYGDWESAIYEYGKLSLEQKEAAFKKNVKNED